MTYTSFLASLRALTVTGVTKKFNAPPSQISSAMLPAMYPLLPEGNTEVATFSSATGMLNVACDLVIVVGALGQSTSIPNMDATIELMDALHTALDTAAAAGNFDRWSMRMETDLIGETAYWRIVARVEASG